MSGGNGMESDDSFLLLTVAVGLGSVLMEWRTCFPDKTTYLMHLNEEELHDSRSNSTVPMKSVLLKQNMSTANPVISCVDHTGYEINYQSNVRTV